LQWPFFAGFCVYAYRKFVRYEETPPEHNASGELTEIPTGLLPERPTTPAQSTDDDPVLREYNAYLAELARSDRAQSDRAQSDRAKSDRAAETNQNRTTA